jgi:adenosine deaminase
MYLFPFLLRPPPDLSFLSEHRTLADCFRLFDVIHRLTTDHATITRITEEVVTDFANDGVVWLELRTSPKVGEALHQGLSVIIAVIQTHA